MADEKEMQDVPPEGQQDAPVEEPPKKSGGGFSLSGYGNSAGDKIASGLAPVGNTVGRGLEIGAAPIGGLVEPLVGGIMKSGKGFGEATGVGAGNNPDTFGKKQVPNDEDDQIAGKEQNAENPLGLQKP